MTWIVAWNGRDYDIDPGEFTGRELAEIKRRAGFSYRQLMTEALPDFDADAIRAVFWTVERRQDPNLSFADYDGPPMRVFIAGFDGFPPLVEELGKVLEAAIPATSGSDGSASSTDGAPPIDLNS